MAIYISTVIYVSGRLALCDIIYKYFPTLSFDFAFDMSAV